MIRIRENYYNINDMIDADGKHFVSDMCQSEPKSLRNEFGLNTHTHGPEFLTPSEFYGFIYYQIKTKF